MRITIEKAPGSSRVASEDSSGGVFYQRHDGTIWYINSLAPSELIAALSWDTFCAGADALNRYSANAAKCRDESKQLLEVTELERALNDLGVLDSPAQRFWSEIVEQAKDGML